MTLRRSRKDTNDLKRSIHLSLENLKKSFILRRNILFPIEILSADNLKSTPFLKDPNFFLTAGNLKKVFSPWTVGKELFICRTPSSGKRFKQLISERRQKPNFMIIRQNKKYTPIKSSRRNYTYIFKIS